MCVNPDLTIHISSVRLTKNIICTAVTMKSQWLWQVLLVLAVSIANKIMLQNKM